MIRQMHILFWKKALKYHVHRMLAKTDDANGQTFRMTDRIKVEWGAGQW